MRIKGELTEKLERELLRAKIRNVNAQADKTEFKASVMRGEYVKVSDVKKEYAHAVQNVKAKLLGLHVKLAPQLENVSAQEASEIVKLGVIEALKELADTYGNE